MTRDITRPVRVLGYVRARDAHLQAEQSALLQQYIREHDGWELVSEVVDSHTRQALQRALEKARASTYDVLLVHSLSRLSRSVLEMSRILEGLESSGVTVHSITEPLDLAGPTGRLLVQVLAAMAEYERNLRRRARTARALAREDR